MELDAGPLILRPVTHDVARALLEGRAPDGLVFAPGYPSPFSLEVMDLIAGARAGEWANREAVSFFMVRAGDGAVVGEVGYALDPASGVAMVGYSVVEPSWGRGYATAALRGLVAHLRGHPGVRRIVAETFADHVASRRVMEKAGLRHAGEKAGEEDGQIVELVVYELVC